MICAVVVTYERPALLAQCLEALLAQTIAPDRIVVVDNASRDGTVAMVRERFPAVDLLEMPDNLGPAIGFDEGLRAALAGGATHAWMMDDDTIATPDALERLTAALATVPDAALLSSVVEWSDGSLHPMNLPGLVRDDVAALTDGVAAGLLPIRTATFVSLLVSRPAIERFGGPPRHFFLWSDDMQFTATITRDMAGYLVPDSVVEHRTRIAHTAVTEGGARFYYHVRNTLFMLRGQAWRPAEKLSLVYLLFATTVAYLRHEGRGGLVHVAAGLRDGLRGRGGRR